MNLSGYQTGSVTDVTSDISKGKELKLLRTFSDIKSGNTDDRFVRSITLAQEKGVGAWLSHWVSGC